MERNPYAPPSALVADIQTQARMKTSWGRAAAFYWAFLWRTLLVMIAMMLLLMVIYPFIALILSGWPVFERLIRLAIVLAIFVVASCVAIKWAAQASFSGNHLRILKTTSAAGSGESTLAGGMTLARAARLFWAHFWRYALVVVPVNLALIWSIFGRGALAAHDLPTTLKVQVINLPVGFIVAIWAMREALSAPYRGFQLQWVAAEPGAEPNVLESSPSSTI